MGGSGQTGGGELTADECVRAGMYWFGRSDFEAARAWWQRALELDPRHMRAQECLRLLVRTASAVQPPPGAWSAAPSTADLAPPRSAPPVDLSPARSDLGTHRSSDLAAFMPRATDLSPFGARSQEDGSTRPSEPVRARTGDLARPKTGDLGTVSPWDDGPSRTSVVTIRETEPFDALAEATPLPQVDRERFFGRGDPATKAEIMDFLSATGDLAPRKETEILFEAPVELDEEPTEAVLPPKYRTPLPDRVVETVRAPAQESEPVRRSARTKVDDNPVSRPQSSAEINALGPTQLLEEARRRFALHDFLGALELLERIPVDAPGSDEARNLAAEARVQLMKMYESKIGNFDQIPRMLVSNEEVIWLNLNHRAGFILSQIDGAVSYDDLIALSGMPRLDTIKIIADLLKDKVIGPS